MILFCGNVSLSNWIEAGALHIQRRNGSRKNDKAAHGQDRERVRESPASRPGSVLPDRLLTAGDVRRHSAKR